MNTNDIRATKERSSRSSKENVISKKYSVKKPRKKDIAHAVATLTNVNVSYPQEVSSEYLSSNLCSLESVGIRTDDLPDSDSQKVEEFKRNITLVDGVYHVKLMWDKAVLERVPSNYIIAKLLAKKVHQRNVKTGLASQYTDVFDEQLRAGIIEPIKVDSDFSPDDYKWLPHYPIVRQDELVNTTRIRPVFNCSYKSNGNPSLNDASFAGIDLVNKMLDVIMYARTNSNIVLADIEKAFLQIKLRTDSDRNKFAFLLYRNGCYEAYRYSTIIFGYNCSPFILQCVLQKHADSTNDTVMQDLIKNKMYVDNLVFTYNNSSDAHSIVNRTTHELGKASFILREFAGNDNDFMHGLPADKVTDKTTVKLLGYAYDTKADKLSLKVCNMNKEANTRRQILATLSEVFDPIGIGTPLVINGKLLMRKIVELKTGWDEPLPLDIIQQFQKLCNLYEQCAKLYAIPRKMLAVDTTTDIAVFADASKTAYGFVAYTIQGDNQSFMFSKTKLAPMPHKTLPSLELMSVFLALKCMVNIIDSKNLNNVKFRNIIVYSDSQVALSWLLKEQAPRKNVFVNNRLKDIKLLKETLGSRNICVSHKFIVGSDNVSDCITRCNTKAQIDDSLASWLRGPVWLCTHAPPTVGNLGCIPTQFMQTIASLTHPINGATESLINVSRHRSYKKVLGVTTLVFLAVSKFKRRARLIDQELKVEDAKVLAFKHLFKEMQYKHYRHVIEYLTGSSKVMPVIVQQLNLFLDTSNIIRSRSRAEKSLLLTHDQKYPVLIAPESELSKLLILHSHNQCYHLGTDSVVNNLRNSGFWIPRVRAVAQKLIKQCVICQRYRPQFKSPTTCGLPVDRVNLIVPFAKTGIDYTGHYMIDDGKEEPSKYYLLIFTCLVTRAIHLEVVNSMSTEMFLLAMIRFCNRYGVPKHVYSDNAKSYIAGGKILSSVFASDEFSNAFKPYSIEFRHIPTYSPWYGATWERLIKTVKLCVNKTIGRRVLNYFNFITMISDVQSIINNRPLTYRSSDNGIDTVTPNHFLRLNVDTPSMILTDISGLPDEVEDPDYDPYDKLITSLDVRQQLVNKFYEIWLRNYLLSLKRDVKNQSNACDRHTLHVGNVAIMQNMVKTRPYWKLVRIMEHVPSTDGNLRAVKVQNYDGSIATTSIKNLVPLELPDSKGPVSQLSGDQLLDLNVDPLCPQELNVELASNIDEPPEFARPKRAAAERSRQLTKEILEDE
jgi:hypothetical protein